MPKARSRLARLATNSTQSAEGVSTQPLMIASHPRKKTGRGQFLKTLILGLLLALGLVWLMLKFSPDQVKNWLIPNAYLPFFVCLFGTNFFLFSFLFLDSAIGMWWSILVCSFVFLRLQQVIFSWPLVLIFLAGAMLGLVLKYRLRLFHH